MKKYFYSFFVLTTEVVYCSNGYAEFKEIATEADIKEFEEHIQSENLGSPRKVLLSFQPISK